MRYKFAENREEFHVFTPSSFDSFKSEVAVVRVYGEQVYAVPLVSNTTKTDSSGRKTTDFEKQLIIMKTSDIKTPLSLKRIGHLQAKP